MGRIRTSSLVDAGCDTKLIDRCERALDAGDAKACLRMLRAHRCDLVEAMHRAQQPIDVCD